MDAEHIVAGNDLIAIVIPAAERPTRTTFVTGDEATQQVGFIVYPAGGEVRRHRHREVERSIRGTGEVVFVREGACDVDLYDRTGEPVGSRRLERGDAVILMGGGHGFRMHEDTVLVEVKQGPYGGLDEKEFF